jgi:phage shock protein PspC (stress-responsive transcriptional regulator)
LGGCGGVCAQPATIRISAMWVVFIEIGVALFLAVFIVWFTWPKKKEEDKDQ